jgi:hypothetical protein
VLALLCAAALAALAPACPFCTMQGQTLTGEINQASLVLYGTLANAKAGAGGLGEGTTDLVIEAVIKPHDVLAGRKSITLDRYIPLKDDKPVKYLVLCDVFKGKIDPYRAFEVPADSDMPKYLKGALGLQGAKIDKRLRFFFDYLDNPDLEVATDAYKEFANADYKDVRDLAATLPADRLAKWLDDKNTPAFRYGLYASLLGHCGKPEHAALLRSLLESPDRKATSGVDGILAGYVMLQPKEGWEYIRGTLADGKKDFMLRYAALKSARFLWEYRPDLVAKKDLKEGVALLLAQGDIADLAVEDLRKWGCWDMAGRVMGLRDTPAFEVPVVRRAVLRFALCCKGDAAAERYVAEQRKKDPQGVADAEELLKTEQAPAAAAAPAGK